MRIAILKIMCALKLIKEYHPGKYKMVMWNPIAHALLITISATLGLWEFLKTFYIYMFETFKHALTDHGPTPQGLQTQEADLAQERARIRRERLDHPIEPTREFTPQGQGGNDQPSRLDPPEYG